MRTASLLLILATMPLLAQIRSDQAVSSPIVGASPATQEWARVASDGTNFFAVWRMRTPSGLVVIGGGRISPDGQALDQPSLLIASGSPSTLVGYPEVVFVGGNYLVAYESDNSVMFRRISRDGQLIDSAPVVISNRSMYGLATNGKTVLLASGQSHIRLLAADGSPLAAEREVPYAYYRFSIGSNGDRYLIAYPSSPDNRQNGTFLMVGADGDVLLTKPIPLAAPLVPNSITVTSNGSSFLLSMSTNGPAGCMAVDADGNAGAFHPLDGQSGGGAAVASWSGANYTLAWVRASSTASGYDIVGARVDTAGVPIDATPVMIASALQNRYAAMFASAWNGNDTFIATGDSDHNYEDWHTSGAIFTSVAKINTEPERRRHVAIASSAPEQTGGSIASNGTLSLVAWRERAGMDQAVARAAFIAADGQLGTPFELGDAHSQSGTAVASDGRDFLVIYVDSRYRLVARRVAPEGLTGTEPIVVTIYGTPTDAMAVGWSGQAWVVVTASYSALTVTGVSAEGTIVVPRQIITTTEPPDTPSVSCGANGCSLTWHRLAPWCGVSLCGPPAEYNVFARTDAAGNVLSQVVLTNAQSVSPAVSIAGADGRSIFFYASGKTMFAGRITEGGTILDPPAVNGGFGVITTPSLLLAPITTIHSGLYFVDQSSYTAGHLYWTRIDPEPRPHVTALLDTQQLVELPVTLTASNRNTFLVLKRGEIDPDLMAQRLFVRTLASPDPVASVPRRHATR